MKMVVQKNWPTVEASQTNATQEDASTSTSWTFQAPAKTVNPRQSPTWNVQTKQPITRQIAINTLAAMHRRFSLPGPMQPHSRPIAEFRANANKSLDMLRQTIQSAVTREIDQVIKKYLEKFFVPAVNNIRLNLGEESVSEDQVRAVCRAMLDATRLLYTAPPRPAQAASDASDADYSENKLLKQTLQSASNPTKRKESDIDSDIGCKRKRIKQEEEGAPSPAPLRDPEKWSPARLTQETLFIMGSHAHKVLGMGNARGRLYARHAGLPRYPADTADKEWIASHNLVNAVGGKTYIMILEDIEELAHSEAYRHSSLPLLGELTGFKVPPFMLLKIKAYLARRALSPPSPASPQLHTELDIKTEPQYDYEGTAGMTANEVISNISASAFNDSADDFADIKVDGIKIEDIDDIKVEDIQEDDLDDIKGDAIKAEDLDVDCIKVEDIKEEDIKLENDDTLSVCKQTEDEMEGLLDADIEFLSQNLDSIENEADARKTIEKLTGAPADTITLVGDEFDLGTTLNTNNFPDNQTTKCITVASTTSGMVHCVPVAVLASPRASTVHYYTRPEQLIRGIPINTKTGTFSTVMSSGTASLLGFGARAGSLGVGAQYHVTTKSFPTGNILHNAIVSRGVGGVVGRPASTVTFNLSRPAPAAAPKAAAAAADFDAKDALDGTSSSVMLKKVLTLGSAAANKSFVMHNTQKVLSTGFANGTTPPPNVTIVSSGHNGTVVHQSGTTSLLTPATSTLSATHATLSALLASSGADPGHKRN